MKKYRFVFINMIATPLLFITSLYSQTTTQPTPVAGTNSVKFETSTNKYKFYLNRNLLYEYLVLPGTTTNGGSFNTLKAYADNGTWFIPSNFGGITAILGGIETGPWEPGVTFTRIRHQILTGDTVYSYWKMMANNDYCYFTYKMKIVGRTLIIKVEFDTQNSGENKATLFSLDRCENATKPKAIAIPYLPMFYILLSNGNFTSFFTDWEVTNCTRIIPHSGSNYSSTSIRYAHDNQYSLKTNKQRNRLFETLYLTTSPDLNDVLPNIPNPISPYKEESANRIVWDYREPFARLVRQPWNFLQRLKDGGVNNIWLQIHDWQKYHGNPCWGKWELGYDDGLPCVLPANEIYELESEYGGFSVLDSVILVAQNFGYRTGFHQNYVDYYPNASIGCDYDYGYNEADVARNSDGSLMDAFKNPCTGIQSKVLKPSKSLEYLNYWSQQIQSSYNINACYLDVHSASMAPYVDCDASVENAGMFRETVKRYRALYSVLRQNHKGPVQGEGGAQFLYQGYVDDIEARLITPKTINPGYNIPLLVDFNMNKLRTKTMVHGVGWYPLWLSVDLEKPIKPNWDEVLSYIATEIAYGHGGYLPDEWDTKNSTVDFVKHAQTEYNHVYALQKYIVDATPLSVLYGDSLQTASDYIKGHQNFADINSEDFLGKVKVTYDNGIIVYVNRHPTKTWNVAVGTPNKWFSYHAIVNGTLKLYAGHSNNINFVLPPNNGWVVYNPVY